MVRETPLFPEVAPLAPIIVGEVDADEAEEEVEEETVLVLLASSCSLVSTGLMVLAPICRSCFTLAALLLDMELPTKFSDGQRVHHIHPPNSHAIVRRLRVNQESGGDSTKRSPSHR